MGTRGLLGFIIAAQRYGSYNHWDSYPSGLGADIVKFILGLGPENCDEMAKLVAEITWVNEAEKPTVEIQDKYSKAGFSNVGIGEQSLSDWYCLLAKTQGAAALPAIQSGELKHMIDSRDFLANGLFCEWAYFIDFENRKLETWARTERLDEMTFDELVKDGVEGFLARLESDE
ncbi:hypothetical protein CPB84DRAFT_1824505 [Gymnopilus junonius]|uniref:Uncharacterized protein n=1 Tax=Gymnopilus junonius TaxID=109634 RepID=A0A9P5NP43_GYMJU|nr:hypothetical protein CPB84DRAFT_1824505 [Gymnopilus junonius]